MPDPLSAPTAARFDLSRLGPGVTLVTPNRRLAEWLRHAYDAGQRASGRMAWESADIVSFFVFVARCWQAGVADADAPSAIGPQAAQCLWEEAVTREASQGLLSIAETARAARSAWQVAHVWNLWSPLAVVAKTEDSTAFLAWTGRYRRLCRERRLLDEAELPDALVARWQASPPGAGVLPRTLLLAGFDIVTPQQETLFAACRAQGVAVETLPLLPRTAAGLRHRYAFPQEETEIAACAAWARRHLEENRHARIGIVVPDLARRRDAVERALLDTLHPAAGHAANVARAGHELVNVSLGRSLAQYGLVRDALALIEWSLDRPLPFHEASAVLRSPFVAGATSERASRAILDRDFAAVCGTTVRLSALRTWLWRRPAGAAPLLRAHVQAVTDLVRREQATASSAERARDPADWSRFFIAVLDAWGFPGEEPLDSRDWQVVAKFRECLTALAALAHVSGPMRATDAARRLAHIVADTVFQPQQESEAPVQVLGMLESAGLAFDALWIMGLDKEAWPVPSRPHPFIPAAVQRRAGMPEADAAVSLSLDRRLLAGWLDAAGEVVLSHAVTRAGDESERAASTLIAALPVAPPPTVAPALARVLAAHAGKDCTETIAETPLAIGGAAETIRVHGGTAVLRDMAACPFRAFARHRLDAEGVEAPQLGLTAAERGTLVHRVLASIWQTLGTQAALQALDDAALTERIAHHVRLAMAEYRQAADGNGMEERIGEQFAALERMRIADLVRDWLLLERSRDPFTVAAIEEARQVSLGGLEMTLRLDRLDRLPGGERILIDYKTGEARLAGWWGERPDEPQMPAYLVTDSATEAAASEVPIAAMTYASLKRGPAFGFVGVAARGGMLPGVKAVNEVRGALERGHADWDSASQTWRRAVTSLAARFRAGHAAVDPKSPGETCRQCDLHGLCRVNEAAAPEANDD